MEADGFEVIAADEVIWQNRLTIKYGKMLKAADVDCVMFNYCVWAWPGFARVAAQFCPKPIILYANVNPRYPAVVGMLANAGSLEQIGSPSSVKRLVLIAAVWFDMSKKQKGV